MKTTLCKLSVLSSIVLAMFFTSCGKKDTPDSVTDELLTKFDELITTLESVKDKDSAEAAAKKIDTIGNDFQDIAKRLDALPEPSEEEKKALDEKMDKAMDAKQEKMGSAMKGVMSDPEAAKIIMEAMKGFGEKMQEAEKTFKKFGKKD
ncbi:hypothetical protein NT6N_13850 [Oceaniferula spumae]|uniref:Uncharacterized protein n=1 Tax=Oceaniferula spumae TaxID=2979115 RepID=A0AAT9FK74_9BACT